MLDAKRCQKEEIEWAKHKHKANWVIGKRRQTNRQRFHNWCWQLPNAPNEFQFEFFSFILSIVSSFSTRIDSLTLSSTILFRFFAIYSILTAQSLCCWCDGLSLLRSSSLSSLSETNCATTVFFVFFFRACLFLSVEISDGENVFFSRLVVENFSWDNWKNEAKMSMRIFSFGCCLSLSVGRS